MQPDGDPPTDEKTHFAGEIVTIGNDEYGRRTLEFVEKACATTNPEEIWQLAVREMKWYGLDYLTIWSIPSIEEELSDVVDYNTRPSDYINNYNDREYVLKDPVVSAMRHSMRSLSWSDVRESKQLSKPERLIIEEARDFGATDGLTIPVVTASGCAGVVSPCGREPNLTPRARAALELVALYTHQALRRASKSQARNAGLRKPLTPREREVMRWVALGKTNDEIGCILNVERATIKTILSRAQEKLNATRRTYAVVQALRYGELDLNF